MIVWKDNIPVWLAIIELFYSRNIETNEHTHIKLNFQIQFCDKR